MKARIVYVHKKCNTGKLIALDELQKVYRAEVQRYADEMIMARRYHIKPKELRTFFSTSVLSSQLRKCASSQAVNLVESWVKALYYRMKKRIYEQNFTDRQRMELRCIGKHLLTKAGKFGKGKISQDMIDLYWSWIWDEKISGSRPTISEDFPMWLSEMCIAFGEAKKAKALGEWWIAVSCLNNGKRLQIPLSHNPFLQKAEVFAKSVLIQKRNGQWSFQFTDKTPDIVFPEASKKLGLDVGLNVLAATSDGELYGKSVKPIFDKKYKRVLSVRANRQRQNLKDNSKRLARLEQNLTGFVKTEIGNVVNQLVKKHPDTAFVIEALDLRGCKGQKRFAYRFLHRSLQGKAPTEEGNPAFSSQMCPSCGYISRNNRNGVDFHCRSCGRISHADVVGGKNLLGRSEDKQIPTTLHYRQVESILRERFCRRRNSSLGRRQKRTTVVPDAYCNASGCIASNVVMDKCP